MFNLQISLGPLLLYQSSTDTFSDLRCLPPDQCWVSTGPLSVLHTVFTLFPRNNIECEGGGEGVAKEPTMSEKKWVEKQSAVLSQ